MRFLILKERIIPLRMMRLLIILTFNLKECYIKKL